MALSFFKAALLPHCTPCRPYPRPNGWELVGGCVVAPPLQHAPQRAGQRGEHRHPDGGEAGRAPRRHAQGAAVRLEGARRHAARLVGGGAQQAEQARPAGTGGELHKHDLQAQGASYTGTTCRHRGRATHGAQTQIH